jgi:hypothetical protein
MSFRWEFTDDKAADGAVDQQVPAAAEQARDTEADAQATAGQQSYEVTDVSTLAAERDNDALANLGRDGRDAPGHRAAEPEEAVEAEIVEEPKEPTVRVLGGVATTGVARGDVEVWREHPEDAPPQVKGLLSAAQTHFGAPALRNRQVDGATAFLAVHSGSVERTRGSDGVRLEVPTELERAQQNPASIVDMVLHAPKTEFQLKVEQAERDGKVDAFEQKLADFARAGVDGGVGHDGQRVTGFWDRLKWTDEELQALKADGKKEGWARKANFFDIQTVKQAYFSNLNTGQRREISGGNGEKFDIGAGTWTSTARTVINNMDTMIKRADPGHRDGLGSVAGSSATQDRLLHLLALEIPHEVANGTGEEGRGPHVDQMKLQALRQYIDGQWKTAKHDMLRDDLGAYTSGERRMTEIPPHIEDLEALYTALEVRFTSGDTEKLSALRRGVVSIEKTRLQMAEDAQSRQGTTGHVAGNAGPYSEDRFRLEVLEANTQYLNLLQGNGGVTRAEAHLTKAVESISGKVIGRDQAAALQSGQYQRPAGIFGPEITALLGEEELKELLGAHLREAVAQSGKSGMVAPQMERVGAQLAAQLAATRHDLDGSYAHTREAIEARLAEEKIAADHPPEGRRLIYVGDTWTEDGQTGLLEVFSLLSGTDHHLDSAGNSPLADPTFRSYLQDSARQLGIDTEIHRPLERIVPSRQWENVHFVGRLPDSFTARDVLGPIAHNGLGTMEMEVNGDPNNTGSPNLYDTVMRAIAPDSVMYERNPRAFPFAGQFRVAVVPTRTLRVLNDPSGRAYTLDHDNPQLNKMQLHTLALFRNMPDGSPSDLFMYFKYQYDALQRANAERG